MSNFIYTGTTSTANAIIVNNVQGQLYTQVDEMLYIVPEYSRKGWRAALDDEVLAFCLAYSAHGGSSDRIGEWLVDRPDINSSFIFISSVWAHYKLAVGIEADLRLPTSARSFPLPTK